MLLFLYLTGWKRAPGSAQNPETAPRPDPTNVAVHKCDKLGPFELNGSTVRLIRVRGVVGEILYLPPPDGASVFSFFLDIFWMLPGSPAKCLISRGRKTQSRERKLLMLHRSFANDPTNLVLTEVRHTVILPSCVCLSWHHFRVSLAAPPQAEQFSEEFLRVPLLICPCTYCRWPLSHW